MCESTPLKILKIVAQVGGEPCPRLWVGVRLQSKEVKVTGFSEPG